MDAEGAQASMEFPTRKVLHLVRHAQGHHNVAVEKDRRAIYSDTIMDAELSPLGWEQVAKLRREIRDSGLMERVELVVTSPFKRTLQTSLGVFGEDALQTGLSSGFPPFLALELCRERYGRYPCDKRGNIKEYKLRFPKIDFSLIRSEEDELWKADEREHLAHVAERGMQFLKWAWSREEKEIAVVSHGIFLQRTLARLSEELRSSDGAKVSCERFQNCELRTLIIDESMMEKVCPGSSTAPQAEGRQQLVGFGIPAGISKGNALGQADLDVDGGAVEELDALTCTSDLTFSPPSPSNLCLHAI